MAQSLHINKKKYLTSAFLSKQFGYSADYISRLAREGKIIATQVNRVWFIEPESLKTFSMQIDVERQIRQDFLRSKRKSDQLKKNTDKIFFKKIKFVDISALTQTSLVLLCGVFIGSLLWMSINAGLTVSDFASGSEKTLALVSESVIEDISFTVFIGNIKSLFTRQIYSEISKDFDSERTQIFVSQNKPEGTFTNLPKFPGQDFTTENNFTVNMSEQFSDEVVINYADDGSVVVQPVFKSGVGDAQGFLLVPVDKIINK